MMGATATTTANAAIACTAWRKVWASAAAASHQKLEDLSLETLEKLWDAAKAQNL